MLHCGFAISVPPVLTLSAEIAAYFGISVRSLQLLTHKHPEVREARQRGRSLGELDLLFALWQRMPTSDRILRFMSKMYLGWTTT
jgi:hypothetical protein